MVRAKTHRIVKRLLLCMLFLGIGMHGFTLAGDPPPTADVIGQKRPDFSLPDLQGTLRTAEDWSGQIMIVNFWATWCAPCKKEIPIFNQLQAEYKDAGVQFIGIAVDDDKAVIRFKELFPIDYPVLIGDFDAIKLSQTYGNVAGALPYTVFIDRNGNIVSIASGGLNKAVTRNAIEKLL